MGSLNYSHGQYYLVIGFSFLYGISYENPNIILIVLTICEDIIIISSLKSYVFNYILKYSASIYSLII